MNPLPAGMTVAPIIAMQAVITFCCVILIIVSISWLVHTTATPSMTKGAVNYDYDAAKGSRKSLKDYLSDKSIPDSSPLTQFSIATANFGGIFTQYKDPSALWNYPWTGFAATEIARLQVEAGARALTLDIWPDPSDFSRPVIACMLDTDDYASWPTEYWWKHTGGLNQGVGRYSNWHMLTHNSVNVGEVLKTAVDTAFNGSSSNQNEDPFFLILNLHGAMTVAYLNKLGNHVNDAITGYRLGAEMDKAVNQINFCQLPISSFYSRVTVIVNPDIQPNYNALPSVNTRDQFNTALLNTTLGKLTNVLTTTDRAVVFEPANITAISAQNYPNCSGAAGDPKQSLAETGLCVVQPTVGGSSTSNDYLFRDNSYQQCLQSGAQFVAVNLFSQDPNDSVIPAFFNPAQFGTYSFKLKGT